MYDKCKYVPAVHCIPPELAKKMKNLRYYSYEFNPGFETSPRFFSTYVDLYRTSTQKNLMQFRGCFTTRTDFPATMAASGFGF